jgi:Flp pilus assembly protein TadG
MSYEKGIVMKKKLRREAGGAAAEFAIILPLLIFFIFGIVEFGFLLYNKQVLTNASREGARAGIVVQVPKPTDQDIRDIIANYCNGHLINFNGASATISATDDSNIQIDRSDGNLFGDDFIVRVSYTYNFLVLSVLDKLAPYFTLFGPIELEAITVMKHE